MRPTNGDSVDGSFPEALGPATRTNQPMGKVLILTDRERVRERGLSNAAVGRVGHGRRHKM